MRRLALIVLVLTGLASSCLWGNNLEYIRNLSSPNILLRQESVKALGLAGDTTAVPYLVVTLDDPVTDVRLATAKTLGTLGDRRATDGLLARLGKEDDPTVRVTIAESLGKLQDTKAVPDLLRQLDMAGLGAAEQYTLIWALGNIGDKRAEDRLGQLLASPDKFVAFNASQALRRLR
jgi:HEAT repeat protein